MPATGDILGNYRILRLLGAGGFAEVFEAEDPLLQRTVALKVLMPEVGRTPDMLARFQREVRSVAALNHPGIVSIYSVGESDGVHYYAMRLMPGGDLRRRIGHGLAPERALEILEALASALQQAHEQGIVHRDIKPENILFDEDDNPVLTDFGIAKVLRAQEQLTAIGTAMGTPQYLSPEQARGGAVDARTDLYGLGVILYEMLTGSAPYTGSDPLSIVLKHATEPIPALPPAHARLQPLIEQLMAKLPAQRPGSAAEVEKLARQYRRLYGPRESKPDVAVAAAAAPPAEPPKAAPPESRAAAPIPPPPPAPAPEPAEARPDRRAAPAPLPDVPPRPRVPRTAAMAVLGLAGAGLLIAAMSRMFGGDSAPQTDHADIPAEAEAAADVAAPSTRAGDAPAETREQRVARERKRCALHVSSLTEEGNLVYDDALRFPGATMEPDGSGVRVPRIQLANGQWVNALVTPEGCVLIRSLAAGAMPAASE